MRTALHRSAVVAACVLGVAVLPSATPAANSSVINREKTSPGDTYSLLITATGIEDAVRRYLGGSSSTRLVVAVSVIHGNRASVAVERYAGPLAGEGRTLELDRVHGQWRVVSVGARPDWVNWAGVRPRRGA